MIQEKAKFIEVSAEVRYWEDTELNGVEDTNGNIPLRSDKLWIPIIDLETGIIQEWPIGNVADIHYKVCDQGEYWLLDEHKNRIAKWKDFYVPNSILCINDNGFGDYIIFKVDENGKIKNWRKPFLDLENWELLDE